MKILQMSRLFFPHVGGASIRVYQIAKNLTKFGHKLHLLTHNPKTMGQCNLDEKFSLSEEHPDGFHVYRLPYCLGGKRLNWALSIALMTRKALEIIETEGIEVILSHNPPYLVGAASHRASARTGKPVVTVVHDVWGASHYSMLERAIGRYLEGQCVRKSNRLIVPLKGLDDVLVDRYGVPKERFVVGKTGVDPEEFRPAEVSPSKMQLLRNALEECGVDYETLGRIEDPSYRKVLFVGILAPWSGCSYLIEAARKLEEKTLFLIAGHGVQMAELKEKAGKLGVADKVLFLGAVRPGLLPMLINLADVCASTFPKPEDVGRDVSMPVRPISTLEFMSCGRPVVMSDIPGAREIIEDGKNGMLFSAGDADALAEKLSLLLKDRTASAALGKAARESILDGNTWADTAKVVENALQEAVASKDRRP